jgi:RNA polymerase sigma-70 factor (ECF subfamily)
MRGAAESRAHRARTRSGARNRPRTRDGLDALADLVDDVLRALGAQPAFATTASSGMVHRQSTVGTLGGPDGRSRPTPHPRPNSITPEPSAGTPVEPDDGDSIVVDEEHQETWKLVQRAQGGDAEAFGLLYDRYVDMVFRFVYYRVNDRALAEDFTSETFLRALRRISSITYQGRDIGAWFVTIARNIVLDHMKSARRRLESPTADTIEPTDAAHMAPSTETAVLDAMQSEQLMAAVARLGDEQRECVMLRFVHGLSVNETASVMGKNDGAIKALQHRAVRKLADLVGGELR